MRKTNSDLMKEAREALSGKWGVAIGAVLLYMALSIGASFLNEIHSGFVVVSILIGAPLGLGFAMFSLNIARGKEVSASQIFDGFNHFGKSLAVYLLVVVIVMIGMMLLIIPGIIASLALALVFFIMADDPSMEPMDILKKSRAMMEGNKGNLFVLMLIFMGLSLLCLLTFGIGYLWLVPFMQVTMAKFYDDIKSGEEDMEFSKPSLGDDILDEDFV